MKESTLESLVEGCASQKLTVRIRSYRFLTQKCTSASEEVLWSNYASLDDTKKTLNNIKIDLFSKTEDVGYEAAGVCGSLLANDSFLNLVDSKDESDILSTLIKVIKETKEKRLLIRILWSISKSRLKKDVYQRKAKELLEILVALLESENSSSAVLHEILQVIYSMLNVVAEEMVKYVSHWFILVFSKLFHVVGKVRTAALLSICHTVNLLNDPQHDNFRQSIIQPVMLHLKTKYSKQMYLLMHDEATDILKIWKVIILLLGKDLHSGTTLINGLLEVLEKAFKSPKSEIRVEAFCCWKTLIDNFSLDIDVLTNIKRLKLLLAPLKTNNTKTEDIAQAKLLTWWHLICVLSKTSTVSIETVVAPLLRFCFSYGSSPGGSLAGLAERNLKMSGAAASPGRKFCGLHVMCAEILAQILCSNTRLVQGQAYKFTISRLEKPLVSSPTVYARHHSLFLSCFSECVQSLNASENNQLLLGMFIFQSVLVHTKAVLSLDAYKKDSVETVKELFLTLTSLEKHCQPNDSQSLFVYKFLEMAIVGNQALPVSVLNSRQYHIASGGTMGDMINGTLCNHLIHQLCKPSMLHHATVSEDFFTVWLAVLNSSKPMTGKLGFLYSTMKALDTAIPILCPSYPDSLIKLWATVVQQLLLVIETTQVIDQGDGSENDWGCIYTVLLFPLRLSFDALSPVESHTCNQPIMKSWTDLWIRFTELTQLSVTAEANVEVEHIGRTLLVLCQDRHTSSPDAHASAFCLIADVLTVLTQYFRYTELGKTPPRMYSSPAKPRKKPHPLHNLAACVELFSFLFEQVLHMVSSQRQHAAIKLCETAMFMIQNIHQAKANFVIELIINMVKPLTQVLEVNPVAKFNSTVEKKIITMFSHFLSLVQEQYGKKYTGDQLTRLLPMLKVAMTSTNEGLQSEAIKFWRNCFSSTTFDLPPAFLEILKLHHLPPASLVDLDEDHSFGLKDNVQVLHTSSVFMREARSKVTPSKVKSSLTASPGGSKLGSVFNKSLDDMRDEDFVRVMPPRKSGQRVLTDHQLERMREQQQHIPALYSDLSQASQFLPQTLDGGENEDIHLTGKTFVIQKVSSLDPVPPSPRKKASKEICSVDNDSLSFSGKFTTPVSTQKENVPGDPSYRPSDLSDVDISKSSNRKVRNIGLKPVLVNKNIEQKSFEKIDEIYEDNEMRTVESSSENVEKLDKIEERCKSVSKLSGDVSVLTNSVKEDYGQSKAEEEIESKEKEIDENDLEVNVSPTIMKTYTGKKKTARQDVSPRRYGNGESDYTDEELDEELRKTSLELQKSLDIIQQQTSTETHRRKLQTPVKKSLSDIRKSLRGNNVSRKSEEASKDDEVVQSVKSVQKQRINFREVVVSPSVVTDDRLVKQVPEVLLKTDNQLSNHSGQGCLVSDSDSEDEIPNSQSSEEIMNNKSVFLTELLVPLKGSKFLQEEEKQAKKQPGRPLKAKRNRSTVEEEETSDSCLSTKKRKIETDGDKLQKPAEMKQSSRDDSVIMVEEEGKHSERSRNQRRSRDDFKQYKSGRESFGSQNEGSQDSQSPEDEEPQHVTPQKVTRSGRKIVAPKRDMPEPMTPPGTSSLKRRRSQEIAVSGNDYVPKVKEINSSEARDPPAKKCLQKKITEIFELEKVKSSEAKPARNDEPLPELENNDDLVSHDEMEDCQLPKLESLCDAEAQVIESREADSCNQHASAEKEVNDEKTEDPDTSVSTGTVIGNIDEDKENVSCKEPHASSSSSLDPPDREELEEASTAVNDNIVLCVVSESTKEIYLTSECDHTFKEQASEAEERLSSKGDRLEISENSKEEAVMSNQDGGEESQAENNEHILDKTNKPSEQSAVVQSHKLSKDSKEQKDIAGEDGKDAEIHKDSRIDDTTREADNKMTSVNSASSNSLQDTANDAGVTVSPVKTACDKTADLIKEPQKRCDLEDTSSRTEETEGKAEKVAQTEVTGLEGAEYSPLVQQQEELSPEKPSKSKLKMAVSTPERLKKKGCFKYAGSRAAMLVACAKQNIKNRGESPTKSHGGGEDGRHREGGFSPGRRSAPSKLSPSPTPSRRKRKHVDSEGGRPWAKHEPSPGASPSSSILKKALNSEQNETPSPPLSKYRRVSFADPPVSDKVEIPPSPRSLKGNKAQKRLDMTNATSPLKDTEFPTSSEESQEDYSPAIVDCYQPIYPDLASCQDKVEQVVKHLTSPTLVDGLVAVLAGLGVQTVGQLSKLTEADISRLPVRSPKITCTLKVLKKHEENRKNEKSDEAVNDVEAQMQEMFSGLDCEDKKNLRPSQQDWTHNDQNHLNVQRLVVQPTDEVEDVTVDNDVPQVPGVEGVSPLDSFPEEIDLSVWKELDDPHCLDQMDVKTKENLLNILLQKLPYKSVIDSFHQYLSRRTVIAEASF